MFFYIILNVELGEIKIPTTGEVVQRSGKTKSIVQNTTTHAILHMGIHKTASSSIQQISAEYSDSLKTRRLRYALEKNQPTFTPDTERSVLFNLFPSSR